MGFRDRQSSHNSVQIFPDSERYRGFWGKAETEEIRLRREGGERAHRKNAGSKAV